MVKYMAKTTVSWWNTVPRYSILWYLLISWAMLNGGSPFRSFGDLYSIDATAFNLGAITAMMRLVLAVRHQQKLPDAHRGQLSRWLQGKAFGNQEANRTSRSSFVLVILQAKNLSTFCSLEDNSKPNQICFPRSSLKHNIQILTVTAPEAANEDVP